MQVRLRDAHVRLYYAGRKHWVSNPEAALELQTIEHAVELSRSEDFQHMEIIASFEGESACEFVLPVAVRSVASGIA